MISQIRLKGKANTTAPAAKTSKPFSLLEMELTKFKKQQMIPKAREIHNLKINIRSSISDKKIEKNSLIDNNSSLCWDHSSQTNTFSRAQLYQNNENIVRQSTRSQNEGIFQFIQKKQALPEITSIETSMNIETRILDENINNEPTFLTLENITNREEHVSKIESKQHLTSLNYIFMEDINNEKQKDDKLKKGNIYIDMKKKIKKISKTQKLSSRQKGCEIRSFKSHSNRYLEEKKDQLTIIHNQMLKKAYQDTDVIIDGCIYRNKIVPQRIDNDVDTDDQQINSGIRRLHKSLSQVALQYASTEKVNIVSFRAFRQTEQDHLNYSMKSEQNNEE